MGKYSIKEILSFTQQSSKFNSRFFYMQRDVLKGIQIKKIKKLDLFNLNQQPEIYYDIRSASYPQYKPYINVKGKYSRRQRKIKHFYDIYFQIDETKSLNTKNWKWRVGSEKEPRDAPQAMLKSVKNSTLKKWKKQAERKFKTKKEQNEWVRKLREDQKKKGKYLTAGDWMSQVLGINGDFLYRLEYVVNRAGHLYGRCRAKSFTKITNPQGIIFFDKHSLNFIQVLLKKGILKAY